MTRTCNICFSMVSPAHLEDHVTAQHRHDGARWGRSVEDCYVPLDNPSDNRCGATLRTSPSVIDNCTKEKDHPGSHLGMRGFFWTDTTGWSQPERFETEPEPVRRGSDKVKEGLGKTKCEATRLPYGKVLADHCILYAPHDGPHESSIGMLWDDEADPPDLMSCGHDRRKNENNFGQCYACLHPDYVSSGQDMSGRAKTSIYEGVARLFHEKYEMLAPDYGYATREESAVEWEDVPANNRALMIATARAVLATGVVTAGYSAEERIAELEAENKRLREHHHAYVAKSGTSDYRDDSHHVWGPDGHVARCDSRRLAQLVAEALNVYRAFGTAWRKEDSDD